eukprot:5723410-Pleurochrysis_carterae.AAC.1
MQGMIYHALTYLPQQTLINAVMYLGTAAPDSRNHERNAPAATMAARLLRPMRRSYSMRDTTAAMERLAASDGLSLPEQNPFAQLFDGLTYVVGTGWWLLTTCVLVAYLCFGIVPWWIVAIGAAECYTSGRRYLFPLQDNRNVQTSAMLAAAALSREASKCSIRRFISFRFHAKAPVEQVVASFKALSAHPEV